MIHKILFGNYIEIFKMNDKEYKEYARMLNIIDQKFSDSRLWEYGLKPFCISSINITFIKCFTNISKLTVKFEEKYKNTANKDVVNGKNEPLLTTLIKKDINKLTLAADSSSVFAAGIITPSSSLTKIIIILSVYADIQEQVYNELKNYENKFNGFKLKSIHELHYLRAVVHEVLRSQTKSSSFDRYILNNNITLNGYNIPKGSLVYANYQYILHDNNNWFDADNIFNINNFLDDNNHFKQNPAFVAFGTGKRSCPGESLAIRNIYYFLPKIILRYKISASNNVINTIKNTVNYSEIKWESLPVILEKRSNIFTNQ